MWIEFLRDYDWYPERFKKSRHSFVRYKKGKIIFVTRDCANETIAAGVAKKTTKPKAKIDEMAIPNRQFDLNG